MRKRGAPAGGKTSEKSSRNISPEETRPSREVKQESSEECLFRNNGASTGGKKQREAR
jgi:hypothetical protein